MLRNEALNNQIETGVSVAIRVRPFNQRELRSGEQEPSLVLEHQSLTTRSPPTIQFNFDHVLGENSSNYDMYVAVAQDVVESSMNGINGTIFAYGQTSSGKTHTMFGSTEEPGIMTLATRCIFQFISKAKDREFLLRVSYVEIYNEVIRDLLKPSNDNLKIHQNPSV